MALSRSLLFCCCLLWSGAALTLQLPALSGRVVDQAGLLGADDRSRLEQQLAALEQAQGVQFVVVTLKSLQGTGIEDFGLQLGRSWGIGHKGRDDGVLLIVAPNERKVRLEVGYGLEGVLTDAVCGLIIRQQILPRFRQGDYPGGIRSGVDSVIETLQQGHLPEALSRQAEARQRQQSHADLGAPLLFASLVLPLILKQWIRRSLAALVSALLMLPAALLLIGSWPLAIGLSAAAALFVYFARDSAHGRHGGLGGASGGGFGGGGGGFSGGGGGFGGGGASGGW